MKAEIIVIGTELTRGIIQDKHGSLISHELTSIGVHVSEIIVLPDDGTIEKVLEEAIDSSDLIIITGGLGPTCDDMTRSVIAESAGKKLIRDEKSWDFLLAKLGDKAYGANSRQAMIPEGFDTIPNNNGTAPGFYGYAGNTLIVSLPGPPREMHPMFYDTVLPIIRKKLDLPDAERDEYSSFITAEAKLEELFEEADPDLDWGTRFQDYRISVYVSGKTADERNAAIGKLRDMVGLHRIETGDKDALGILIDTLKKHNATVSAAESCTGGLISELLTSRPGSSSFMLGSVTSYAASAKINVLGVPEDIIDKHGTVSFECAEMMADGARKIFSSDYSVSVTGVAGPDTDEGKAVGTVYLGFSGKDRKTISVLLPFSSWGRESIRRKASTAAFILLSSYIEGEDVEAVVRSWKHI